MVSESGGASGVNGSCRLNPLPAPLNVKNISLSCQRDFGIRREFTGFPNRENSHTTPGYGD